MPFPRRWFKVDEVAQMLGASPKTIRNWISAGRLPAAHPAGVGLRVDILAVNSLFEGSMRRGRNAGDGEK